MILAALLTCTSSLAHAQKQDVDGWPWAKYGLAQSRNPACIPAARDGWWPAYHRGMLAREKRGETDLVFLGDSITMMWRSQSGYEGGTPVWQKYYGRSKAANLGISGDETEHILWRITEGHDLDGLSPKVLVLLIGINNLNRGDTPEQTAEGIVAIVGYLGKVLPHTKVLLLGVFPCGKSPKHPIRERVRRTNRIISKLADDKQVYYLDIGDKFVEPDGTIESGKLRDLLHLSEKGYEIWAAAMEPYLNDLLTAGGQGAMWREAGRK